MSRRVTSRNPVEAAAAVSEAFLGRPADSIHVVEEDVREHTVVAGLARLLRLVVWDENELVARLDDGGSAKSICRDLQKYGTSIRFDAHTWLASNEERTQLYVEDGDQSIDLAAFHVDATKESIPLGRAVAVEYFTAKHHLGREDKRPGPYIHDFAEEWLKEHEGEEVPLKVFPVLLYDRLNEKVSLAGGIYHIDLDMDGGRHSAGIRD